MPAACSARSSSWSVYDTKTDPTVIASVASQMINGDHVVAMTGFTDSDSALALGPIFQQAGIPFVTPGATSPLLPEPDRRLHVPRRFGDNVQAAVGAEFVMSKLGQERLPAARQVDGVHHASRQLLQGSLHP